MPDERYPHPRFPGVEATRTGEVFSHGKQLKGSNIDYPQVYIRDDNRLHQTHRIVYECVSGESLPAYQRTGGDGVELNHKDGDTRNPAFENLELISHQDNVRHSWQVLKKRQALAPGVLNSSAKLSEEQVKEVIRGYVAGDNCGSLGRQHGVDDSAISRIIKGTQYRAEFERATADLGYVPVPGEDQRSRKLRQEQVELVITRYVAGERCGPMARELGVDPGVIEGIIKRKTYKAEVAIAIDALGVVPIPGITGRPKN
jgi:hypothetical protein